MTTTSNEFGPRWEDYIKELPQWVDENEKGHIIIDISRTPTFVMWTTDESTRDEYLATKKESISLTIIK